MRQYTFKRIGLFVPTILLMTILVFFVMRVVPGDPAIALLEGDGGGSYTQQDLENLRAELGTDRNIAAQYVSWLGGIIQGDFGDSYWFKASVMTELGNRMPRTLELAVLAITLSVLFSVPLGIVSAIKPDSWLDLGARTFTIIGIAIPNFLMAILMILLLLAVFNWLPPLGYVELWENPLRNLQQMIFPAIALAIYDMAFIGRVTRSSMMEVLREDYMRTARAKGLAERVVLVRHGLKNAFLPILTISGWQFARLFEGAVIIETIFLIPGVGRILIEAIFHRDFPMIQAVIVVIGTGVLLINLVVDLLYGWLDPRIRYN
ncbi:MAG: ABC transporter permease [Chloroflexota bacterium]|jgi:peptide/nickel transport system permease protein|nr:MAG: ABC transporter permease [SAR202 cluster bacterium]MCH2671336.1 ABC transporter permease [Dehalococcoidia bacterium]MEE3013648.1 ABC transporter permease [Chloroflexota bacterium]GIS93994.1 MAG: peptide ABC transporter permease [Dehalococcoidia bacterium]|tara:strand:+ start:409 stop:1365 length:957 start_codon:yes stop_codon:yes gene_type:complete